MEALEGQSKKRAALESQLRAGGEDARKAARRAAVVPAQLDAVDATEARLSGLLDVLGSGGDAGAVAQGLEELGLSARLGSFDVDAAVRAQWGRPSGFDGLVLEGPRGIPVLVGRRAFRDEAMRRASRGADLWFQAAEGGSRVLLRTSMVRSLAKAPREGVEFAADLAAFFSPSGGSAARRRPDDAEPVEVHYTDSRRVAKRGGRVGQMKSAKRLGTVWARPERVADEAKAAQEAQGWL